MGQWEGSCEWNTGREVEGVGGRWRKAGEEECWECSEGSIHLGPSCDPWTVSPPRSGREVAVAKKKAAMAALRDGTGSNGSQSTRKHFFPQLPTVASAHLASAAFAYLLRDCFGQLDRVLLLEPSLGMCLGRCARTLLCRRLDPCKLILFAGYDHLHAPYNQPARLTLLVAVPCSDHGRKLYIDQQPENHDNQGGCGARG